MDDRALKLFAKLDADFPAERVQALEILRAHLQKTGQSFRDIVRDIGNAAAATLKNAELQLEQLYRKAAADNAQWAQQYQTMTGRFSAQQTTTKMMVPWWASGLAVLVLLFAGGAYFWLSASSAPPSAAPPAAPSPRPSAQSDLNNIVRRVSWHVGDSKPVIVLLGGIPFWMTVHGYLDAAHHANGSGEPGPRRCLYFGLKQVTSQDSGPRQPFSLSDQTSWSVMEATRCERK